MLNLPEPTTVLYRLAQHVRPGLIVFQEVVMSMSHIEPACTLTRECRRWIDETFRQAGVDIDMGLKTLFHLSASRSAWSRNNFGLAA